MFTMNAYKSLFRQYRRTKNFIVPKVLHNRVLMSFSVCVLSVGALQGYHVRQRWLNRPEELKLDIPLEYPTSGIIKIKTKLQDLESQIVETIKEKKLVKDLLTFLESEVAEELRRNAKQRIEAIWASKMKELPELGNTSSSFSLVEYVMGKVDLNDVSFPALIVHNRLKQMRKKTPMRLTLIGDSLVCGVGCDKSDSKDGPVMPRILASILSVAFGVDVEWESHGMVGSTVGEIREKLLPQVVGRRRSNHGNDDERDVKAGVNINECKC